MGNDDSPPDTITVLGQTRWEKLAQQTKWGRYLAAIEQESILYAHQLVAAQKGAVLDIGCGGGRWSKLLYSQEREMIGTEIWKEDLDIYNRQIPSGRAILVKTEDQKLPCDDNTVSLTLCIEVPPVINSNWIMKEVNRVLVDKGVFVGTFFNNLSLRGIYQNWYYVNHHDGEDDCYNYYQLSFRKWEKELSGQGFTLRRKTGFCWLPFHRESNNALIPITTTFEHLIGLRRLTSFSPWVIFVIQKTGNIKPE